jgi:hypothetical protein
MNYGYTQISGFDKAVIVQRIQKNRDRHRNIYERAMEIYRERAIEQLNSFIDDLKAGKNPKLYINLPVPEDHTKDYDAMLDMLQTSTDPTVELDEQRFRQFVRDEWDWKAKFLGTVNSYVADYVEFE